MDLWGDHIIHKLDHGDLQHRRLMRFLRGIAARLSEESNNDAVICVGGERNMGKSSFAIICAIILRRLGLAFDFTNVFYGLESLQFAIPKITTTRRNVFVFDEMIDFAFSKEAMSSLNKGMAKILIRSRKLNHVYFFCIPRFRSLDGSLRNDVVHFWIEVIWKSKDKKKDQRFALAVLFRKDRNTLTSDPWGVTDVHLEKRRVFTPKQQLRMLKRVRSFRCTLAFPALPAVIERAYEGSSRDSLAEAGERFVANMSKKPREPKKAKEEKEKEAVPDTLIPTDEKTEDGEYLAP